MNDVILVGPSGSGKTTLIRRFRDKFDMINTQTQQTIGSEIENVLYKKRKIVFKEVGFQLINTWQEMITQSRLVLFIVDASDQLNLVTAHNEFYNFLLLQRDQYQPVCLVFNKMDSEAALSPQYLLDFFDIQQLILAKGNVYVELCSGITGGNTFKIMEWIYTNLQAYNEKKRRKFFWCC